MEKEKRAQIGSFVEIGGWKSTLQSCLIDVSDIVVRVLFDVRVSLRPDGHDDTNEERENEAPRDEVEGRSKVREVPLQSREHATDLRHLAAVLRDLVRVGIVDGAGVGLVLRDVVVGATAPVSVLRSQRQELDVHCQDCEHHEEGTEDETLRRRVVAAVVVQLHAEAADLDALETAHSGEEEEEDDEADQDEVEREDTMQDDEQLVDGVLNARLLEDEAALSTTVVREDLDDGSKDDADGEEQGNETEEDAEEDGEGTHATAALCSALAGSTLKTAHAVANGVMISADGRAFSEVIVVEETDAGLATVHATLVVVLLVFDRASSLDETNRKSREAEGRVGDPHEHAQSRQSTDAEENSAFASVRRIEECLDPEVEVGIASSI